MTCPLCLIKLSITIDRTQVILDRTNKETHLIDASVPNSRNLHRTITKKPQKYMELKEEIISIWQLKMAYKVPLVLSTTGSIPNKLHERLKLFNLSPALYILMQKAVVHNTYYIVKVFGRTVSKKCLVIETSSLLSTS